MSAKFKLEKTHTITGTLEVVTGLHVGAGKDSVEIGGIDNPIIKHPHTGDPFIPGSSLKGKVRSLLEWALDCVEADGSVYGGKQHETYPADHPILRAFGTTHKDWQGGPARLIVRDTHLDPAWRRRITDDGLPLTEDKAEVTINRIEGKAASMGPRHTERVPAGARFRIEILFKEFSEDGAGVAADRRALDWFLAGLRLLEQDALGGSGSRGYGQVKFKDLELDGRSIQERFDGIKQISKDKPPVRFLDEESNENVQD